MTKREFFSGQEFFSADHQSRLTIWEGCDGNAPYFEAGDFRTPNFELPRVLYGAEIEAPDWLSDFFPQIECDYTPRELQSEIRRVFRSVSGGIVIRMRAESGSDDDLRIEAFPALYAPSVNEINRTNSCESFSFYLLIDPVRFRREMRKSPTPAAVLEFADSLAKTIEAWSSNEWTCAEINDAESGVTCVFGPYVDMDLPALAAFISEEEGGPWFAADDFATISQHVLKPSARPLGKEG